MHGLFPIGRAVIRFSNEKDYTSIALVLHVVERPNFAVRFHAQHTLFPLNGSSGRCDAMKCSGPPSLDVEHNSHLWRPVEVGIVVAVDGAIERNVNKGPFVVGLNQASSAEIGW